MLHSNPSSASSPFFLLVKWLRRGGGGCELRNGNEVGTECSKHRGPYHEGKGLVQQDGRPATEVKKILLLWLQWLAMTCWLPSNDKLFHRGVKMVEVSVVNTLITTMATWLSDRTSAGWANKRHWNVSCHQYTEKTMWKHHYWLTGLKNTLQMLRTRQRQLQPLPHKKTASNPQNEMLFLIQQVVPLALLISTGRFSIHEASTALEQDPVIRSVLARHALHWPHFSPFNKCYHQLIGCQFMTDEEIITKSHLIWHTHNMHTHIIQYMQGGKAFIQHGYN